MPPGIFSQPLLWGVALAAHADIEAENDCLRLQIEAPPVNANSSFRDSMANETSYSRGVVHRKSDVGFHDLDLVITKSDGNLQDGCLRGGQLVCVDFEVV